MDNRRKPPVLGLCAPSPWAHSRNGSAKPQLHRVPNQKLAQVTSPLVKQAQGTGTRCCTLFSAPSSGSYGPWEGFGVVRTVLLQTAGRVRDGHRPERSRGWAPRGDRISLLRFMHLAFNTISAQLSPGAPPSPAVPPQGQAAPPAPLKALPLRDNIPGATKFSQNRAFLGSDTHTAS